MTPEEFFEEFKGKPIALNTVRATYNGWVPLYIDYNGRKVWGKEKRSKDESYFSFEALSSLSKEHFKVVVNIEEEIDKL